MTTTTMEIGNNNIQNAGSYGIYIQNGTNPSAAKGSIHDNMITGFRTGFGAGIYCKHPIGKWPIIASTIILPVQPVMEFM
ncbi:MAG: hypothetical protein IPK03_04975 [Bacteroidetes bacterium]|nr:hypothetical protein [Bacteroidota bacterium]